MPENGGPSSSGEVDEVAVPVSSLRNRWEALSQTGPSVPAPLLAGRAASRTASAPIRKDMPTTKVHPASKENVNQDEPTSAAQPGGPELTSRNSLRPRVSSNPISPSRQSEQLPPSPQPSPPLRPVPLGSTPSRSAPGLGSSQPKLPLKMSAMTSTTTPTQANFPPTPKQSPPSPTRPTDAISSEPARDPSPANLPVPIKKAPPPPPPSRSSKPSGPTPKAELASDKAPVRTLGVPVDSTPAGESSPSASVASLRSMFGGDQAPSASSTPAHSPSPSISRTPSVSSTVSSANPPPVPISRPSLFSQASSLPKSSSPSAGPSIPRRPSASGVPAKPAPPRPPSRASSAASTSATSPTKLAEPSESSGYAFPEIQETSSLSPPSAHVPSLPPRPKPQVPARPVALETSQPPPTNGIANGTGSTKPKPPLPARRPTRSGSGSDGSLEGEPLADAGPPPPIPSNRPVLERPVVAAPPPRLPIRSKTLTPSRRTRGMESEADLAPYVPPPPPPPPSHTARLDRATSLASNRVASRASSRQTSPLPPSSRELLPDLDDGYKPPPPPVRKATVPVRAEVAPPSRRKSADVISDDERGDGSDDEDDGPEGGASDLAYVPSAQQFKKVDDLPDPTLSNRRPPVLRPRPVRITGAGGSHHISSFASCGDYVAVGSFHLRVYNVDDQTEQGPVLLWDQKEMGLDVKCKDPRISALCFRPVADEGETARYLWCGSKDGHVWEVDVWGAAVVQTRSNSHPSPVTQIYKYDRSMLTLDDTGKACLYTMNEGGSFNLNVPTQNLRIAERQSFTTLLGHQLWTASGPISTNSSIKSAASRGPTIRVYEPFTESTVGAGGRVLSVPDTVTGAVVSATIIPSKPHLIYIGHEGGHVSIWARDSLVCMSVLKISTSAVLSLVGVGSKLWAGTRTGVIYVYDVESRPWTITNLWKAHDNTPVLGFEVDVLSMNKGYLRVYSWGRENCVYGWDGLLADDWQESNLLRREAEFCTYRNLTVLSCSWNIDASKPEQLTGTTDNAGFLTSVLTSEDSPDVIVFGFQELIDLDDKKLQAKTLLFGKSKTANGEMSEKVSQRYRLWHDKLVQAVRVAMPPHAPYTVVHAQNLVGLFTCIFVKNAETLNLRDIAITTVKRGMAGMYGNKGAIIARFVIDDSSVCFINCHLAAGQSHKAARNADLASILDEESRFPVVQDDQLAYAGGGDGSMILDHDLCFLQGDLNYRIDLRRENVISSLRAGERAYLLEHDQLLKEMRTNSSFRLRTFNEAPIAFDPTYKYDRNSDQYDSSEKRRVPAWCDRILFRSRVPENIEPLHYKRYEPTVSDHRPISAGFLVKVRKVQLSARAVVADEVREVWEVEKAPVLLQEARVFYASL